MTSSRERRPRVVLADDHPSVLIAFNHLLQTSCDVVACVSNGQEAIDAVGRLAPDILVVDLTMPDLDGLKVCRKVKQAVPDTDVVIVTAFDDMQVKAISFQHGAAAFVTKYQAVETLVATIQRVFAEKQKHSASDE